jgi:antitoxin CptB
MPQPLSLKELNKLRWRSRRGLLENDLLLTRFFAIYGDTLCEQDAQALRQLLNVPDNTLLDLVLERAPLTVDLDTPEIRSILAKVRGVSISDK